MLAILQPLGATSILTGLFLLMWDRDNDFIGWALGAGIVLLVVGWLVP